MIKIMNYRQLRRQRHGHCSTVAFLRYVCFLGMTICLTAGQVLAADIEVLTPRGGTTIVARNAETHLVLRQLWSAKPAKVLVDKTNVTLEPVVVEELKEHNFLHFRLPLKPGANSFTILPGKQRFELKYRPVQADLNPNSLGKDVNLFHLSDQLPESCAGCHDLLKTKSVEPVGLSKLVSCATCHQNVVGQATRRHGPADSGQCLTCHQTSLRPWRIGFPAAKTEEICFACHTGKKDWRSRKFLHAPLNVGGCNLCHNPHGENYRYMLWAEGSTALCLACHSDKENLVSKDKPMPFVHGIIKGMGCVACHDPHAEDQPFLVRKPINELCVGCHTGLAGVTRGHPVGGHPVAGPKERRRPNRELNCTSCHDPHGSNYENLLIGDSRRGKLCIACHR